jgi:hypothetical protein
LETKRQAIAERVWEVKKTTGWKLRSVVADVAKEMRCSVGTIWSAWGEFGDTLARGEALSEKYDLDALVAAMKAAGSQFGKLPDEYVKMLENIQRDCLDMQKPDRSK